MAHSLSPPTQNAAFTASGLGTPYDKIAVSIDELPFFVDAAKDRLRGFNITVPHKSNIIPYLDEIDHAAGLARSVNTVVIKDGRMKGYSTDGYGLATSLKEAFGLSIPNSSILFLGCGGAVQAVSFYFAMQGAKALYFANRSPEKAKELIERLKINYPGTQYDYCPLNDHNSITRFAQNSQVAIQGTSLGLKADDPMPVAPELVKGIPYYDTIYKATPLLRALRNSGTPVADGRTMLLHQGARSFEIWTGLKAPVEIMRQALEQAIGDSNA